MLPMTSQLMGGLAQNSQSPLSVLQIDQADEPQIDVALLGRATKWHPLYKEKATHRKNATHYLELKKEHKPYKENTHQHQGGEQGTARNEPDGHAQDDAHYCDLGARDGQRFQRRRPLRMIS
jgi:hypothetical protein